MSKFHPFLGALALLAAGCSTTPEPAWKKGNAKVGHDVAQNLCSSCHAIERTGVSPNPGAPPFRTILEHYPPNWLADDLHKSIAISHARMPTFYFGEDHEYDVVAYLMSIQEEADWPPKPGHPN